MSACVAQVLHSQGRYATMRTQPPPRSARCSPTQPAPNYPAPARQTSSRRPPLVTLSMFSKRPSIELRMQFFAKQEGKMKTPASVMAVRWTSVQKAGSDVWCLQRRGAGLPMSDDASSDLKGKTDLRPTDRHDSRSAGSPCHRRRVG